MASITPLTSQLPPPCETQSRPLYNFPRELWRDRIASIPFNQDKLECYVREVEILKRKVEDMLKDTTSGDAVERMKLIYTLYRLGISYNFQAEIEKQLHQIIDLNSNLLDKNDYDLYTVAVVFQIFRQHGVKMSCDVFKKFKDSNNGKFFKDSLTRDTKGLLGLFEAAHLATHGEEILDEALAFTRMHLEKLAQLDSDLRDEVLSSLKTPLFRGPPRLKVREFISFYEKCHQDYEPRNDTLLKFAKLDFNRIQLLHQQEIRDIFKWSVDQNLQSKLPFARDRIMEYFFWSESIFFEPKYAYARAEYIKQCNLVTFLDDVYDTYGEFDELPMLTDAMERWDRAIIDQLPKDYMKHLCTAYLDCFDELENHAARDGTTMCVSLTKDYLVEVAQVYMLEAKWIKTGYIPSFKESLDMGVCTAGTRFMHAISFMGMGEIAVPAFQWLGSGPTLAHDVCVIVRLRNELVSYKRDEVSKNPTYPFISYKRENKASEEETVAEFERIMSNTWKTVNEELMRESANVPLEILMPVVNFGRLMEVFYKERDAMTDGKYAEKWINTLYIDPIPL